MEIYLPKSCENAPRKKIVADFTIALLKQTGEAIKEHAAPNIQIKYLHEKRTIVGIENVLSYLRKKRTNEIRRVEVDQVLTHGKGSAINGQLFLANEQVVDFCYVYLFASTLKTAKVKEIKSYWLI